MVTNAPDDFEPIIDRAEELEKLPPTELRQWKSAKRKMLGLGIFLLVTVPSLTMFLIPSAANSVESTVHRWVHGSIAQPTNPNNVVNIATVGMSGFGLFAFCALAGFGILFGLIFVLNSGIGLVRGPLKAAKSPTGSVNQFYANVLSSGHLAGNEIPSRLAAFMCLSGTARRTIRNFGEFSRHWSRVRDEIRGGRAKIEVQVRKPTIDAEDSSAQYVVSITCTTFVMRNGERADIKEQHFQVSGGMTRVGKRWYVTNACWRGLKTSGIS